MSTSTDPTNFYIVLFICCGILMIIFVGILIWHVSKIRLERRHAAAKYIKEAVIPPNIEVDPVEGHFDFHVNGDELTVVSHMAGKKEKRWDREHSHTELKVKILPDTDSYISLIDGITGDLKTLPTTIFNLVKTHRVRIIDDTP